MAKRAAASALRVGDLEDAEEQDDRQEVEEEFHERALGRACSGRAKSSVLTPGSAAPPGPPRLGAQRCRKCSDVRAGTGWRRSLGGAAEHGFPCSRGARFWGSPVTPRGPHPLPSARITLQLRRQHNERPPSPHSARAPLAALRRLSPSSRRRAPRSAQARAGAKPLEGRGRQDGLDRSALGPDGAGRQQPAEELAVLRSRSSTRTTRPA